MAYLRLSIQGNTSFGGYISVDGSKSVAVKDGALYDLSEGQHYFVVSTTSDASRKFGKTYASMHASTSSGSMIGDAVAGGITSSYAGNQWSFQVVVDSTDEVHVSVHTKGSKIIGDPMYSINELDEQTIDEYEAILNVPSRNQKLIKWGIALIALFAFGLFNVIGDPEAGFAEAAVMIGGAGIGALLFVLGMKKKTRR